MDYNKSTAYNCKVTVSSGAEAKKHMSSGVLTAEENGFTLLYSIDGDNCVLSYNGSVLTQKRTGAFQTEISFCEGTETECGFSDSGFSGKLPVICERLEVISGKLGVNIKIKYDCGGEGMNLILTAAKITEKK